MAEYTDNYGLIRLLPGEGLSTDNYKAMTADRDTIDAVAYRGATSHVHDGAAAAAGGTIGSHTIDLDLQTDEGGIPAGTRAHYVFTLVIDGLETAPSDVEFVDTASPVATPAAPVVTTASTGGTLEPGNYFYIITAWVGQNTSETRGLNADHVTVPAGTATNKNTITATVPAGADGYNVYRKKPGAVRYAYLATVTGTGVYNDTGATAEDANRTTPTANYTNSQNHVVVDLVGVALDPGDSWKLYRSYVEDDWLESGIATISGGVTTFDDLGETGSGSPPLTGLEVTNPSKVLLTGGAHVQGILPASMVSGGFLGQYATISYPAAGLTVGAILWDTTRQQLMVSSGATPAWTALLTPATNLSDWFQDNVTASQTAVALLRPNSRTEVPMSVAGSVVGIVVYSNAARTTGTLTVDATINGTVTGLTAVLDGTNTTVKATTQLPGLDTFTAGQRIGVKITTDGTWAPTTADIDVSLLLAVL